MDDLHLTDNRLLSGADGAEGIVAAELAGRFIRLFVRTADGVVFRDLPFRPFTLLEDPALLGGFRGDAELRKLSGTEGYRFLALFKDWRTCLEAKEFLARKSGKTASASDAPYLHISDPVHQHFLLTGTTLFKGISFDAIHRLAIDIETACAKGFEFSNPRREEDRILSIALMEESGYEEFLSGHTMTEGEMLESLTSIIRERDPDVIEGHNIFRFDLEYIRIRAERHGVKLRWGRDGSEPKVHPSRFTIAERTIDYPRWDIYGRHIIDTFFLLQIFDVTSRELESYGLKQAAIHFGLAAPGRVYLDRQKMDEVYQTDPEALRRYNLDDVRETLALSRLLSYPFFLQTRIFPWSYQNCVIRGNATKINALFLREYLYQGAAVPKPDNGVVDFEGGYTDIFESGVLGPIVHCDAASLYPSIMLSYGLKPDRDRLNLFLPLLRELREFRLKAKRLAREAAAPHLRDYYTALQQTFKVLINSFYGYLGTTIHNFSDVRTAAEVTRIGRETIRTMLSWLREHRARPVEVDTDGIYFIPPGGINTREQEEALVNELSAFLPSGIDVEMDGRYRSIFSYKMKNYALLDYDGRVTIKGSGLKSRGIERYLRDFMGEIIRLLLQGEGDKVEMLHGEYVQKLRSHTFTIDQLAKSETLGESPALYQQKVKQGKRNPSAAFEVAIRSEREFRAGDQVSYYITGRGKGVTAYDNCRTVSHYDPAHPDENIEYYVDKLNRLLQKFSDFLLKEQSLFH